MKKFIAILFIAGSLFMMVAHAETESPQAVCTAEADDAGFENANERQAYIADCIEQITQESAMAEDKVAGTDKDQDK